MIGEDTRPDGGQYDQPPTRRSTPGPGGCRRGRPARDDSAAADSLIAHERGAGYRIRWAAVLGDFVGRVVLRRYRTLLDRLLSL